MDNRGFKVIKTIRCKQEIYFIHKNENNISNIFRVLKFQQLSANKHFKLRDFKFDRAEWRFVWLPKKTKIVTL